MKIKIKLIDGGKLPEFKHEDDACCDCYARLDDIAIFTPNGNKCVVIYPHKRAIIPLGFALALPINYEAVIRPRSGLSSAETDVAIGTVDAGYRGEVKACVINNSDKNLFIYPNDRICQMAIREVPSIQFNVCESLDETERGSNGFGSTGV